MSWQGQTSENERRNRLAVVVCSTGRPECVRASIKRMMAQTRLPDRLVYVVPNETDLPTDFSSFSTHDFSVEALISPKGSACQRNHGLDAVSADCDIVVFYDDDFLPSRYALARILEAFAVMPDVNGMTGYLIADGINGPGIGENEALGLVEKYDLSPPSATPRIVSKGLAGLYGCNMSFRMSAVGHHRFDERLPLYSWQEDIDFAARIPGERVKTDAFAGVHMGIKSGRDSNGARLGYSQIVNPWYLVRKGTMRPRFALNLALRNMAANHWRGLRPEPWIDRLARARGNWIGLADILRGRADPGRILTL